MDDAQKRMIQSFLIAPVEARKFFLREIGLAFLINIVGSLSFLYLIYDEGLQVLQDHYIYGLWYIKYAYLNLCGFYYKSFVLITLFKTRGQTDTLQKRILFIRKLQKALWSQYFQSNAAISSSLTLMYTILVFLTILSGLYQFIYPNAYENTQIRLYSLFLTLTFLLKYAFTIRHGNKVQEKSANESINNFLMEVKYSKDEYFSECPICLISFTEDEILSQFQCPKKHIYHEFCVTTWLKQSADKNCPYCRQTHKDIFEDTLIQDDQNN